MSPSNAMQGVRLTVNEEGVFPSAPHMYGLDIPPGVSATVGLTAKRILHLMPPYTNCSFVNPETNLLMEAIKEKLGNDTPGQGEGLINGSYSPSACR